MDLEKCPKCGAEWRLPDRCLQCGFVPIGAGLKNIPKKQKKKVKYVEPGSSRGFLLTIMLVVASFGAWKTQPWQDDWEMVRAMFGQGRRHSVVGEWEIVKALSVDKSKPPVLVVSDLERGTLRFDDKGRVEMTFDRKSGEAKAEGKYLVSGQLVALNGLSASPESAGLPTSVKMNLSWTGPNQVIASCAGTEALYLRRKDEKHPIKRMMRMSLKQENPEIPGSLRGAIGTFDGRPANDLD
jgi:hypothetical protein